MFLTDKNTNWPFILKWAKLSGHTDSPKCLCENPQETTVHYLTQCWLYTEDHQILYDQVEKIYPKFKSQGQSKHYKFLVEGYMKDRLFTTKHQNYDFDPALYTEDKTI